MPLLIVEVRWVGLIPQMRIPVILLCDWVRLLAGEWRCPMLSLERARAGTEEERVFEVSVVAVE